MLFEIVGSFQVVLTSARGQRVIVSPVWSPEWLTGLSIVNLVWIIEYSSYFWRDCLGNDLNCSVCLCFRLGIFMWIMERCRRGMAKNFQKYFAREEMIWTIYIVGRKLFSPTCQAFLLFLQLFWAEILTSFVLEVSVHGFFIIKPPWMIGTMFLPRKERADGIICFYPGE